MKKVPEHAVLPRAMVRGASESDSGTHCHLRAMGTWGMGLSQDAKNKPLARLIGH